MNAAYWVEKLKLEPHPEGGYFRQTYESEAAFPAAALPKGFHGTRAASTAIYFLLEGNNFSAFHRLQSDEMWHFYTGSALAVHLIDAKGEHSIIHLGIDAEAAQLPQATVPAGCWFASHVEDWKGWALVGCTVSPGFDFAEFELAKRENLVKEFPKHQKLIELLTRG